MAIIKPRSVAVLVVTAFFLLSFMWHRKRVQVSLLHIFCNCTGPLQENVTFPEVPSELQVKINDIFNRIQKLIPNVTLSNLNIATNGKNSKAFIVNSREKYCVGEDLVVQLDMYDALGNRKTYGGDFIWTRIFSPELNAAISGRVEDFYNGTYHVHFPLHWQGKIKFSAMLFHPSEGISALWRSRHASLGVIGFNGRFVHLKEQAITTCGFKLQTKEEVCEYLDPDDEEAFYCIKPKNLPCESLHDMMAIDLHSSYLSNEEKQLFQRSNIGVEIPANFEFVDVVDCNKVSSAKPNCQTGMNSPFPSGYFYNGVWNPVYCNMSNYNNAESLTKCLQGKKLFLIGDSTLRQFIMHFTEGIQIVKYFGYHGRQWQSWEETLLAINIEKDIYVSYKRHGFPLESFMFYYFKEDKYTSRQIDQQGGGKDTIFVITIGQHFRQFPLQLYIRRAINIRKAIERLFIRSPETKVIIKTENTREINAPVERIGDFHGYTQYLALREVFQGINVGFVDAWDMTVSSAIATVHPPGNTFQGIMSLTFTFACS
ncbi:NXPE family member 2 [Xenopus laevis]|uniref:NXPE family member 2 n=2 Tax=Xenopus laevis TaxID=8355 RepID=A0A8J1L6F7_XENLA|nr:NXPE family member 2 [Xenopus laevis]XP_041425138.1 NXPE family member 2 [Xenopus laevis]